MADAKSSAGSETPNRQAGDTADTKAPAGAFGVSAKDRKFRDPDILSLDPDSLNPDLHYRWVRLDQHGQSITRHKLKGYSLVKKGGVRTLVEPTERGDDSIVIGDTVLMACPKRMKAERERSVHKLSEERLASSTARLKELAKSKDIEIIEDR